MPPHSLFMPFGFGIELVYTIIISVFCFLAYYKTKEIYDLTKHKGIQFFRYAFMFFGLAYASRLILYILIVGDIMVFEFFIPPRRMSLIPVSNLVMAYFSTMAILYLAYSTVWKKFSTEHFLTFSNIIALFVAVIAFISRSPVIVSFVQLLLLAVTITINIRTYKKDKKRTHIRALYFLIAIFWLISLFVIDTPGRLLPFGYKVLLQIVSIIIFFAIYYRIIKWVK